MCSVVAATCTNSAAALDAHVDRGEYPSSAYSLWEHSMLNSPESANRTAMRYNGQGRELRLEAREKTCAARENPAQALQLDLAETVSSPSMMPAVTRADHENAAPWSSVFASFGRAFALHGTSYCKLLHAIATSPVESRSIETEAEKLSVREPRRSLAVNSPSASPKLTDVELEQEASRAGPGAEAPSQGTGLAEFYSSPPFTDRPNLRHWLTSPCSIVASRWVRWRREREIKKAVAALVALDDRTLQDIGIPHRSQVEQLVRYCFHC
jgi:uncharacterized protein YjiS (DUF1127 family)